MIVVVDTGVINRFSVVNALTYIGCEVKFSANRSDVSKADKLILPGIGAFSAGMKSLREKGLIDILTK